MTPWQEWKKKNAERQASGQVSPIDFLNPDTEYAEEEVASKRLDICKECPEIMLTQQCSQCGCFMPAKVKLLHATCPKGFW